MLCRSGGGEVRSDALGFPSCVQGRSFRCLAHSCGGDVVVVVIHGVAVVMDVVLVPLLVRLLVRLLVMMMMMVVVVVVAVMMVIVKEAVWLRVAQCQC